MDILVSPFQSHIQRKSKCLYHDIILKQKMRSSYTNNLKYDVPAGIVVFFVAVPLCLGIAHASGAPLLSGLISGIIGGILVGLVSKSPLSVSGPAAGLTSIVLSGVHELGSYEAFALAIVFAGIFQIILGALQAGAVSKYFPHCVINGMLAAIGLILIFKQLPHLLGYDIEVMGVEEFKLTHEDISDRALQIGAEEENTFTTIFHSLSRIHPVISTIGISSLLILTYWELYIHKSLKAIPGSVLVVLISTIAAGIYQGFGIGDLTTDHFVNIPNIDGWPSFMGATRTPAWAMATNSKIYILAITVALVASVETLLSVEAVDRLDPHKRISPINRELVAQGLGNTLAGLLGGLPITSVIVRSSVNMSTGARTQVSTIVHGLLLLIGVMFFARYLNYIPLSGLAAILIHTGYKLANPKNFFKQYMQGWDQFIPAITTTTAILLSDLLIGVAIGLVVSMLFIVAKSYQSTSFVIEDFGLKKRMILGESIHFLHKYKFVKFLQSIHKNAILEIDASKTLFIDHDIEEALREFQQVAAEKNITVIYGGLVRKLQDRRKIMESNEAAYVKLIKNNKEWVTEKLKLDPKYFEELSRGQAPEYLFIGCSDSRVPAEDITKCKPGEMFVHRNVANLVVNADINIMSVLQYAVEVLNVKHIILCGHYGCGGIKAAMEKKDLGLINQWLVNVKDIYRFYQKELDAIQDEELRYRRLVELNALEQTYNLMKIPFVQKNRSLYGTPEIHAWAYDLQTGLINDLALDKSVAKEPHSIYMRY